MEPRGPGVPVNRNAEVTMQAKPTADQALVSRLRAGEESAVRDLQRVYRARIYQLASRYFKTSEDAEETTLL